NPQPTANFVGNTFQVLVMPKTPEADRAERGLIARMTPDQRASYHERLLQQAARSGGGLICSPAAKDFLSEMAGSQATDPSATDPSIRQLPEPVASGPVDAEWLDDSNLDSKPQS